MFSLTDVIEKLNVHMSNQNVPEISKVLNEYYNNNNKDWLKYCFWSDDHYTRNLVFKNEDYELIIICWKKDQVSPIHDHSDQNCYFLVLEGDIQEISYKLEANSLFEFSRVYMTKSDLGVVNNDHAWHEIQGITEKAVTLHIYNKPIEHCNIYSPINKTFEFIETTYHTIDKKPVSEVTNN
jgi:cysteine dioxygenase